MSFIKESIAKNNSLTKKEKKLIIDMFNNILINENIVELKNIFDKIIEKESRLGGDNG